MLQALASRTAFSSPAVRASVHPSHQGYSVSDLGDLFKRVTPREGKWLTRLVLKDFCPVELDMHAVLQGYHPLLPAALRIQDDMCAAVSALQQQSSATAVARGTLTAADLVKSLKPKLASRLGASHFSKPTQSSIV